MPQFTEFLYNFVNDYYDGNYESMFGGLTPVDPAFSSSLHSKVYNHYKYFEIGYETYERFAHEFVTKYSEIIPEIEMRYSALENEKFKDLSNDARTRIYKLIRDSESTTSHEGTTTASSKTQFKDTPYTSYQSDSIYNTSVNDGDSSSTNISDVGNTLDLTDDYNETVSGISGITYAEATKLYMDIWFNIEVWVIKQLRDLFMEVY